MTSIGHHAWNPAFGAGARHTPRRTHAIGREDHPLRHLVLAAGIVLAVVVAVPAPLADFTASLPFSSVTAPDPARALAMQTSALEAEAVAARSVWTSAEGHVLDETARSALATELARADATLVDSREVLAWPVGSQTPAAFEAATTAVSDRIDALDSRVQAVDEAVAAWKAEQARIIAEQEAQRAAAAAAAAARTRPAAVAAGAGSAVAGIAPVEGIWTSGGQAEIDACRGSVNLPGIASYLGASFYAGEHWRCGGSAWGRVGMGSLVSFPGYGTYRVAGVIGGLAYGSDASAIPAGYAGYYQTCVGGSSSNMAVWLLEAVG